MNNKTNISSDRMNGIKPRLLLHPVPRAVQICQDCVYFSLTSRVPFFFLSIVGILTDATPKIIPSAICLKQGDLDWVIHSSKLIQLRVA